MTDAAIPVTPEALAELMRGDAQLRDDVAWALMRNDRVYDGVPALGALHPHIRDHFRADAQKALDEISRWPRLAATIRSLMAERGNPAPLPSDIVEACGQVRDRGDVVELVERVNASLHADIVKLTTDRDNWAQAAKSWMDTALSLRDNITKATVERDKARDALSKLIEAFVNPHDGAPFEDGEVPALDHARNVISRTTSNG